MNEQTNLITRDHGTPFDGLAARPPFVTLDMAPREAHLLDYLMVLRKHQWLMFSFFLALVTMVTIATFRMQPVYEATTRIEIDRENTNFLPFAGNDPYGLYQDLEDYIETQSKILVSETLAMQTIKSLNLDQDPRFGGHPPNSGALEVTVSKDGVQSPPPALGAFLGGLSVKRVPNSRLLDVTFATTDPRLAAAIVNAHVNNFIEQNFRSRYEATTQASNWLANQLDELKGKVEASEDARIKYERDNQIWTIDEKQDVTTQKLADVNRELTEAQADRINKQAVYELAVAGNYDAIPSVRESAVMQESLKRQGELRDQYTESLNQYGPKFPKVVRLEAQLKETEELIQSEKKNIGNQIEAEYQGSRRRELLLQRALEQQKNQAASMADKMVQYNILKREAEANKQLYDGLLQKLKEAGITAGLRSSNIRVVDPALMPASPSRPNKSRNISLAILVGLIGGIGLALLREHLDNTVKNPDDVESLSRLPSLAVVPAFTSSDGDRRGRLQKFLRGSANGFQERVALLSHSQPQSQVSEAFRALRTSLLLSQPDRPPQMILVTSALPREGKTTATVNIGVTLAQLGDSTLLIDGDLRKPGISRALHMSDGKHAGLSSYLAGVISLDRVTVPHPLISNLHAIPTGPVPPNSADLLSSHRLAEMLCELRKRYKFIVIDSPPIMAATDAVILSALVDGVLLVVRSGETPKEAFTRTRDLLHSVKSRVLGVVLNAVDSSSPEYYYSYRYHPYAYGAYCSNAEKSNNGNGSQVPKLDARPRWRRPDLSGRFVRALITGGAGFIGSHLAERILADGDEVLLLDNLSTGSIENIRHLRKHDRMRYFLEPVENRQLLAELVDEADVVFHLAAAVGVRLIVESPVRTIETNVTGTHLVLEAAAKKRKLVFLASTSEVYGKNANVPFHEDADLVLGPTNKGRWSYAASKALDEFLALAYWKERKLPVIVARLFNTVGPRQTGRYGMVMPALIGQALAGLPLTVFGSGQQSRCFCDVQDCVEAILRLAGTERAVGEVVNVGTDYEVTIDALAELIRERTRSSSSITHIPYDQAYEPGFEDMLRRVPSLRKLERLTDFRPHTTLPEIIDRVAACMIEKQQMRLARAAR